MTVIANTTLISNVQPIAGCAASRRSVLPGGAGQSHPAHRRGSPRVGGADGSKPGGVRLPQLSSLIRLSNSFITRLAELSQQAHELAENDDEIGLEKIEAEVDESAAELWGITDKEPEEIRQSLKEGG
jgi:hypothetical protein